jgi:TonB family protein
MAPSEHFKYDAKRGFGARYGFVIGILVVAAVAILLVSQVFSGRSAPPRKQAEIVMIRPLATPPPPPPPPPPQVPKPQMEEQTQVTEQDLKPAEEAPQDPTPSLGTGLTGTGPGDAFGLGGRDKGFYAGSGGKGGGGGGRFAAFSSAVEQAIKDAFSRNPTTRSAKFDVHVKVWADPNGRITKVKLASSTGDLAVDEAVRTNALIGRQFPDLPAGEHWPVEIRVNLRRPN